MPHILQHEDSSPKRDSNPRSGIGGRLGKQTCQPLHHASHDGVGSLVAFLFRLFFFFCRESETSLAPTVEIQGVEVWKVLFYLLPLLFFLNFIFPIFFMSINSMSFRHHSPPPPPPIPRDRSLRTLSLLFCIY